ARLLQKDVRRFHVAVNDAVAVGEVDGASQRFHQFGDLGGWQNCPTEPVERSALHELEKQVGPIFWLAPLQNLDDVWRLKLGDGLGLNAEPDPFLQADRPCAADDFQSD